MTKDEAIKVLNSYRQMLVHWLDADVPAFDVAIESLSADTVPKGLMEQYKWERDVALAQLEEYGIGFAERKRDDLVEVVRCKDCKCSKVYGKTTQWLACESVMEGQATDPDGYCYLGERKEHGKHGE